MCERGGARRLRSPAARLRSGGAGAYHVTAYLDGDRCRIEVSDSGPGFPPSTVARRRPSLAEHGRGLHLIAELADHVRFRNRPGRGPW